jgi:hypothetical protein
MKLVTQLGIVGVLVAGAGLTWWFDHSRKSSRDDTVARAILEESVMGDIQRIEIKDAAAQVSLAKSSSGRWSVSSENSVTLPADGAAIATWLETFTTARPGSVVASQRSAWANLGLEGGKRVRILGADDRVILDLLLGNLRPGSGGQFVAFEGRESAYVVSNALHANADTQSWELRRLLDVKPDLVREIRYEPHASRRLKPVVLSRGESSQPFKVAGLAAGDGSEKSGELASLGSILTGVTWTRRVDPSNEAAKFALSKASKVGVSLTDGRDFDLLIAPVDDKATEYVIQLEVKGPVLDEDMTELNRVMKEFRVILTAETASRFFKSRNDFVDASVKNPG